MDLDPPVQHNRKYLYLKAVVDIQFQGRLSHNMQYSFSLRLLLTIYLTSCCGQIFFQGLELLRILSNM